MQTTAAAMQACFMAALPEMARDAAGPVPGRLIKSLTRATIPVKPGDAGGVAIEGIAIKMIEAPGLLLGALNAPSVS